MKYKDWSNFKVYCSSISKLLSQPRGYTFSNNQLKKYENLLQKSERTEKEQKDFDFLSNKYNLFLNPPVLSARAKEFLIESYSTLKYGIRKASSGGLPKVAQAKGFALEKEGIELLSRIDGIPYIKEVDVVSDDYFIGLCDLSCHVNDIILDIKTSWNVSNFMKNKNESYKLPIDIFAQMQGYLHLYKKRRGRVCYVLVNTPSHLIEQEWANLFKRYTYGEITREKYDEGCHKLESFFDYNKIPEKRRAIRFDVEYSPEFIAHAKKKVDMARVFLNEFEKMFMKSGSISTNASLYLKTPEIDGDIDLTSEII